MFFNPAAEEGGQYQTLGCGGILYDPSRLRHPTLQVFEREHWARRGGLQEIAGGRGTVALLDAAQWPEIAIAPARWVLRHYRRGGLVARISTDAYWWSGAERTRALREWRLLARLRQLALPVPAPIAAGFRRSGLVYRANLITELLPDSVTLMAAAKTAPLDEALWQTVGRTVAAFHRHGVHHVDLNANNILLSRHTDEVQVHLIDFDRGRIRERGAWEQEVVARLRRSFDKAQAQGAQLHFGEKQWRWLLQGLAQAA